MICEHCGKELRGIMEVVDHPCNQKQVEYKVYTDNEMRIAMMELGMPTIGFEGMGYTPPTAMERIIYEKDIHH